MAGGCEDGIGRLLVVVVMVRLSEMVEAGRVGERHANDEAGSRAPDLQFARLQEPGLHSCS